jgi:cell division protein FtsZ
MTVVDAFRMADDVLRHGVQGVSDLVTMTGLINLDFADVKTIMANSGTALMAIGEARGDDRAITAARAALNSPLLDVSIEGAQGVLINITGGPEMSLTEVSEAADVIREHVDESAEIIFGAVLSPQPQAEIKITVIATGLRDQRSRSLADTSLPMKHSPRVVPGDDTSPEVNDLDLPSFLRRRRGQD